MPGRHFPAIGINGFFCLIIEIMDLDLEFQQVNMDSMFIVLTIFALFSLSVYFDVESYDVWNEYIM